MLAVCPISDTLITWIPADEEPLCGNAAVYAVVIINAAVFLLCTLVCLCIISTFSPAPKGNQSVRDEVPASGHQLCGYRTHCGTVCFPTALRICSPFG